MASKTRSSSQRDSVNIIYENFVDSSQTVVSTVDSDADSDVIRRSFSSSTEESSGASSTNPLCVEEKLPPKKNSLKLRTSNSESRASGGSVKYSYDEVSMNFGKPVLFGADKVRLTSTDSTDDIFDNVTFQSPIQDLSVQDKEMLFSAAIASRATPVTSHQMPVPAPRLSKTKQEQKSVFVETDKEEIYEDLDEVKFSDSKIYDSKYAVSSKHNSDSAKFSAPQVPPRNNFILENSHKGSNTTTNNSYENVYCEIHPADKSKLVENLMDKNDNPNFIYKNDNKLLDEDDYADIPALLGARPRKTRGKADTIDIRQTVTSWYEEAEEEVSRDLSLDLSLLENIGTISTTRPKSDDPSMLMKAKHLHQYEHVARDGARFALVNGKAVELPQSRTSQTLLRDFDPIFAAKKDVSKNATIDENDDETSSVTSSESSESSMSSDFVDGASASNFGQEIVDPLKEDDLKNKNPPCRNREENLYMRLPVSAISNRISNSSIDLPPPTSPPPPPPPKTSPPQKRKILPSYENIWIGPAGKPSFLPGSNSPSVRSLTVSTPPPLTPPAIPPRQSKTSFDKSDTKSTRSLVSNKSARSQKSETGSLTATSDSGDLLSVHSSVLSSEGWQCFQNPEEEEDGDVNGTLDLSDVIQTHDVTQTLDLGVDGRSSDEETETAADDYVTNLDLPANPPQRSFSGSAMDLTIRLASNFKRKMSDQVMVRSVLDGRSVISSDLVSLGRRGSGAQKRTSQMEGSSMGLKPGTKNHSGVLFIYSRMKRSFQPKWCVLGNGNLRYFNDKASLAIPKEIIYLNTVLSIRKHDEPDVTGPGEDATSIHVFDVVFAVTPKGKHRIRSFGAPTETEREAWIFAIAQSLSIHLESVDTSDCSYLTWAHLKTGFAGEWCVSWLTLTYNNRSLTYTSSETDHHDNILDLKKIKNLTVIKNGKNLSAPDPSLPVLVVDATDRSLYFQMSNDKEVAVLREAMESVAFNTGNSLKEQQLTHEGIPVIVDKCIRFVYSHGCMTEGIYRHSGVNTKINKLLSDFRQNAWSVHIARDTFSEHDVANTLKRFMRTLNEPILEEHLRNKWMETSAIENKTEKLKRYRELLRQLPSLNYQTLRRIIGHLHAIADMCSKNLMPNYNLAAIWGPTLLTVDGLEASNFARTSGESDVCKDLIDNYEELFNVNQEELDRERKITEVLERINLHDRGRCPLKRSGDLRMWVYLDTRSSGNCVCVEVQPTMTAFEMTQCVFREAKRLEDDDATSGDLILHEVILDGMLERPIHHSEVMLEVTLKWGTWSEADRKDNYLVLKSNSFYEDALPCAIPPMSVFGEAYFSDNKPGKGSFKKHQFSMNNARLTVTREQKVSKGKDVTTIEIGSWPIEDICWYIGCEAKRRPPYNLNMTFIERHKPVERSKERPHFGRTISFESREFFIKWIASMLVAEHSHDVRPSQTLLVID